MHQLPGAAGIASHMREPGLHERELGTPESGMGHQQIEQPLCLGADEAAHEQLVPLGKRALGHEKTPGITRGSLRCEGRI